MNKSLLKPFLTMIILIGVLTFLFIKTREHDEQKHHEVILTIQHLSHQDALLNESILEFSANRFSNYDSITNLNKQIRDKLQWFKNEGSGIYGEFGADLDEAIDNTSSHFQTKMDLIERFKSYNGILKNSMYYLPTAIENNQRKFSNSPNYNDMNHLLREILLFNTWPNDENKSVASMYIEVLNNTEISSLSEISLHASTIIEQRLKVENTIESLFDVPTKESVEAIYQIYSGYNSDVIKSASKYRTAMYAMAVIMIFYLLQLFFTLRRTMHHLEDSLFELAFQKDALDEHAIVASMDPDGIINYVNDKFVEVSELSKKKVVGQPWSILEASTSTDSYFDDMWNTLAAGKCWTGEIKNKKGHSNYYWADATVVPFIDKQKKPVRYVALLTDITERKQNEQRIYNLAHYDNLTGLPNRAYFLDNLENSLLHSSRSNQKLAVLFLDLDNFKMINDTMGHASGDELLKIVGDHLLSCVR